MLSMRSRWQGRVARTRHVGRARRAWEAKDKRNCLKEVLSESARENLIKGNRKGHNAEGEKWKGRYN